MAIQLSYTSSEINERLSRMDLDSTLTLSDHAADAKAVGDALVEVRNDVNQIIYEREDPSTETFNIEKGGLSSNGTNLNGATYLASRRRERSYVQYDQGSTITCDSTYDMAIYFYTGTTASTYISNTGYIGSSYAVPYVDGAKWVRLVMKRVDGANFGDDEIPTITYIRAVNQIEAHAEQIAILENLGLGMRTYTSTDLDDYRDNGAAILAYSGSYGNTPDNDTGHRLVLTYTQNGVSVQLYMNRTRKTYYSRVYADGTWNTWTLLMPDHTHNESQNASIYSAAYTQSGFAQDLSSDRVRVMSYNVAQYDNDGTVHIGDAGMEDTLIRFKQMLMRVGADIVCTQEDQEYIDSNDTLTPLSCLFAPLYPYKLGTGGPAMYYRKAGTVKNYSLESVTVRRGIVSVNSKNLYVYTAHLSVSSAATRQTQIQDILTNAIDVDNPTYWVLCGDFNSIEAEDRTYLINLASTNGYTLANGGYLGWINTNKVNLPLDNFLCSPNVVIERFEVLGNWYKDLWSDHYPTYCDLILLD